MLAFLYPVGKRLKILFSCICILFLASHSSAHGLRALSGHSHSIPLETEKEDIGTIIEFKNVHPITPFGVVTSQMVSRYIPTNFSENASEDVILKRILDKNVQTLFNHPSFKKSKIVRSIEAVSKHVETDFSFSTGGETPEEKPVSHQIKMKILAFQSKAVIHYEGYVSADFTYLINDNSAIFQIHKPLSDSSQLILNLTQNPTDKISYLKYQLSY